MCTVLKVNGYQTELIDAIVEKLDETTIWNRLSFLKPEDLAVIQTSTGSCLHDYNFTKELKTRFGCRTALVSPHVTALPDEALHLSNCDYVFLGEFDYTPLKLARGDDPESISNLATPEFKTSIEYIQDLDSIPFPDRTLLKYKDYKNAACKHHPYTIAVSSRGCPYACRFCSFPQLFMGHKYRERSPQNVVDELKYLQDLGIQEVYYDDDCVTIGDRWFTISELIQKQNIHIPLTLSTRADTLTEEKIIALKNAGCETFRFGIESGNQFQLDAVHKGLDLEIVENVMSLCHKHNIDTHIGIMVGLPHDSPVTLNKTLKFVHKIKPTSVQFSITHVYPGTTMFKDLEEKGMLHYNNWSDWLNPDGSQRAIHCTEYLSPTEIDMWASKLFYRYYLSHPRTAIKGLLGLSSPKKIITTIIDGVKSQLW